MLWPLLLARAPKEVDPVVHLAEGHHQRLDALLAQTDARLAAWASGAPGEARDALALALRELAVVLFEHMGLDEPLRADIVPVAPGVYADYAERLYGTRTPPRSTDVVFSAPHIGAAASA